MRKLYFFLFCLFLLSDYLNGQNVTTSKILGKTFSISYDEDKNIFGFCVEDKENSSKNCTYKEIENTNSFTFANEIKEEFDKRRDDYEFRIFTDDKKISEFSNIDFTSIKVEIDISKLSSDDTETEVIIENEPENFPKFKIKRVDENNYQLISLDKDEIFTSIPIAVVNAKKDLSNSSNLNDFLNDVKGKLDNNKIKIGNRFSSIIIGQFDDLYKSLDKEDINRSSNYLFISTEDLTPKAGGSKVSYSFLFTQNNNTIFLLVNEVGDNGQSKKYGGFNGSILKNDFVNNMLNQHDQFKNDNDNQNTIEKIYLLIQQRIQSNRISEFENDLNNSIVSRLQEIENAEKSYNGQVYFHRKVRLYKRKSKGLLNLGDPLYIPQEEYIYIDSVSTRLFNQRIDNITINAKTSNGKELTLINRSYSLPLREFNNRARLNSFVVENDSIHHYYYYYDDVLDFKDSPEGKHNFAAKNGTVKMTIPEKGVKIEERKIGDYFTGIFFTDFLGLNSNNENSLIVAEGRIRIPWHIRNYGVFTLLDNMTAYASVNLFSGFENSSRKIQLQDTFDPDETSQANSENFKSNNFNLLSNNNVDAGIHITPFTFEWKGASTFIHLRYGLRFLRTGVEYNLKDQVTSINDAGETVITESIVEQRQFQVYSIGHELETYFEIRPQSSVGVDFTVGLNWFRATGTNKNDVNFSTMNNTPNLKVMTNIYAFTNSSESSSGVHFRIGGHYNLGTYKLFPQIMVGYSTNLSSFVNKASK